MSERSKLPLSKVPEPPAPFGKFGELQAGFVEGARNPTLLAWSKVPLSVTGTAGAFDPRGLFIAVGSVEGSIAVLDIADAPVEVRVLSDPRAAGLPVVTLAWAHNGRLLVSCHAGGMLGVWDVARRALIRRFLVKGGVIRRISAHPSRCALVALSMDDAQAVVLNLLSGATACPPLASLPRAQEAHAAAADRLCVPIVSELGAADVVSGEVKARRVGGQPFVIDCAFVDGGTRLVVATTKGSVAKFDLAALLAGAPDAAVATHALVQGANAPALAVSHGAGRVLALSARSGMTVIDVSSLTPLDKGYKETVHNTTPVWSFFWHDDSFLFSVPSYAKVFGAQVIYAFDRTATCMMEVGPPDCRGIMWVDACPVRPVLALLEDGAGELWLALPVLRTGFAGPMYPHGYRVISMCEEYKEPEDEYDNFNEAGEALPRAQRVYDLCAPVDVLAAPVAAPAVPTARGGGGDAGAGTGAGVALSPITSPAAAAVAATAAAAAAPAAAGGVGEAGGSCGGGGGGGGGAGEAAVGSLAQGGGAFDDAAPPLLVLPADVIERPPSQRKRLRRT